MVSVPAGQFYGAGYEDCDRRIPDITKARTLLQWEPEHNIRSVVRLTMEYFVKKHRAAPSSA
jgi:UDP-apiose/xylose synthase